MNKLAWSIIFKRDFEVFSVMELSLVFKKCMFNFYFQSLLKRVNLDKTELCTVRLKILNRRLDHIEVHEKKFLMKRRRQLKNIGSAQKTRQKAMSDRQEVLRKESGIDILYYDNQKNQIALRS